MITQALTWDTWHRLDETTRYHPIEFCHYGMAQRWLVVSSQASLERAEASVHKACQREAEAIVKQLFHLQARRFETPSLAQEALSTLADKWSYHQVESYELIDHKHYAKQGRPTADTPIKAIEWQMHAQVRLDAERIGDAKQRKACFVLGTNIEVEQLSDAEVIAGYKGQAQAEGGFRFLKDPPVFCLVVVREKTLPHSGTFDGDDVSLAGLFGGATSSAPGISPSKRNDPESNPPTDEPSDPEVGVSSIGRD